MPMVLTLRIFPARFAPLKFWRIVFQIGQASEVLLLAVRRFHENEVDNEFTEFT